MSLPTAEAAVNAAPDDDAAWQVYGDALQAAGDPRGELMAVQRKLTSSADATTFARERELIAAHAETWLFEGVKPMLEKMRLASRREGAPLEITWKQGFPSTITLEGTAYRSTLRTDPAELWTKLSEQPNNVRFVRSLTFGSMPSGDDADWGECVDALKKYTPPWLRALSFERGDYWDISSTSLFGLDAELWKLLPRLEELTIEMGQIGLADIDLPALKKLVIISGGFDDLGAVQKARAPKLEHLSLWFGSPEYGGIEDGAELVDWLSTPPPAHLKHLGLCNAIFADQLPKAVLGSKWLAQLTSLDLSQGTMGDEGAAVLLENAERFRHLTKLNLDRGYFSDAMVEKLKAAFPAVQLENLEGEAPPEDRYVALAE
ncbi:MAG: hypothetical protein QM817_16685 [Archangium sp.]